MDEIEIEHIKAKTGARIRSLRTEQGLSLRRLARMVGMDHGYLCVMEQGRANATLVQYVKIASGLGIELKELFDI